MALSWRYQSPRAELLPEETMNRLAPAVLLLAVLTGACQPRGGCFDSGGGGFGLAVTTPPLFPIDGGWEGHEAPFGGGSAWWRIELESGQKRGELRGEFITDRFYHIGNYPGPDTVRGSVTGFHCRNTDEVDFSFDVVSPGNWAHAPPVDFCRFSGRERGKERMNGLLTCYDKVRGEVSGYPSHETAMYLDRVDGPY